MKLEIIYTRQCNDTTIMVYKDHDSWSVYYTRDMYPFMFAFGLPLVHTIDEVFSVAEGNVENYEYMFD